ncbi:MAG: AraC family ligand binding domain-containing protein, partial [Lachnospira sp.]|nr:AraC family ligand binding domain-containing protein [Lachnospira sp.]
AFTASHIHRLLPMPHIHSHLEIIYLIKGSSIAVLDNKKYLLEEGELFISFPNQIHFYHDKNAVEGYMIIFTPELFRELKGFSSVRMFNRAFLKIILNKRFLMRKSKS